MGEANELQHLLAETTPANGEAKAYVDPNVGPDAHLSINVNAARAASACELKNGALRAGEAPRLLSREVLGLMTQYAGVGFVSGVLPAVIYPLLQGYLNAEGTTVVSANVLVHLPWSYKVFLGVLSDCYPIVGYRRWPYMALGWLLCCAMLFVMASIPEDAPYYGDPTMHSIAPDQWTPAQRASINSHAPEAAGKYVIPMMLAAFGYLLAEVPSDAVVMELAQREPSNTRGRVQSCIHCVRMGFHATGAFVVAVAFNGVEYGGSFDFSLTFPQMMFILGCISLPMAPVACIFVHEDAFQPPKFGTYISRFWNLLQQRAVCQIAAFNFLSGVFNNFNPVASSNIKLYWVHATPFNASIMAIVGTFVYSGTLVVMAQRGLHWNWRVAVATSVLLGVAIDGVTTMLVTWDIERSQWFWLGVPIVTYIPHAVQFIIDNYVIVELIELGSEGALFGLLATTTHVSAPFGRTAAKLINARFHVWKDDILRDDFVTRRDVTITIAICYGMKLLSLVFLPLLPSQKAATQALRRHGGTSRSMGVCMVGALTVALMWSTAVNILSMDERTKCWPITGGCAPKSLHRTEAGVTSPGVGL